VLVSGGDHIDVAVGSLDDVFDDFSHDCSSVRGAQDDAAIDDCIKRVAVLARDCYQETIAQTLSIHAHLDAEFAFGGDCLRRFLFPRF